MDPAPDSPKTIAYPKPTTEHRALARVQTRGCHAFAKKAAWTSP